MRVLITGAAGMIGRRLTADLLDRPRLGERSISAIDLADVIEPPADTAPKVGGHRPPSGGRRPEVTSHRIDLNEATAVAALVARRPDVVFHLAGVVSGEAETDLAKGYRVNLDGTRTLFESLAAAPEVPRVVFTSSIAVFGAPFPAVIPDDFHRTPLTSYGAQKAMGELLLADLTRRGMIDGIGIRLPTITVRPGRPNAAASGFFSSIIREPLAGLRATLPVDRAVRHPHASPASAVANLRHAAAIDGDAVGPHPTLTMPALSVTVGEQLDALARVAGPGVLDLIDVADDPLVAAIVAGWPRAFATDRARALGFVVEDDYERIIRRHLDDVEPPLG
ncbi:MAG: D-erythronate dehydrogenase [Actinomycetota bacterium]